MLLVEALLAATGVVDAPDASAVRAMKGYSLGLRRELLDVVDLKDPGRLYVNNQNSSFFERLSVEPPYVEWSKFLVPVIGLEAAGEWQTKHAAARQLLLDRHPVTTIDSIRGAVVMENDIESEAQWLLEVDTVQNPDRVVRDLAAGALLVEQAQVFNQAYPELAEFLRQALNDDVVKRAGAKPGWLPSPWLEDSMRIFLGLPLDAAVEIRDVPPAKPIPKRDKINFDEYRTKAQGG